MRYAVIATAVIGLVAATRSRATPTAPSTEPTHTVWDSVYADSQATHGDSLYKATCIKCHGAELKGGDDGSPLVGDEFFADFEGKTLSDLFDNIRNSMPPDNPKSLSRAQTTQLVAYLLAQNHFPAGATPLTDDPARLGDIKLQQKQP